ncbi:protein FAM163A [Periophthalmus magnuspinnatus]|uniref:protein FAM163A n=1 Tax=Periophthalmus magnuspinnatus TaxID=409849 RepID=UPI00145B9CD0|nr:protein FAM163A [Periophthalmus magnuspinnatus]
MTAGTVVITGGILATVILLCIIAVLCYCRLQYYCCKSNGSDSGSLSQQHFACNACSVSGLDSVCTPLSLSPEPPAPTAKPPGGRPRYCPSCSPYHSPFYVRTTDDTRNGGERVTYMPTHYENPALAPPLPPGPGRGTVLRSAPWSPPPEFYTNTRAVSTEV